MWHHPVSKIYSNLLLHSLWTRQYCWIFHTSFVLGTWTADTHFLLSPHWMSVTETRRARYTKQLINYHINWQVFALISVGGKFTANIVRISIFLTSWAVSDKRIAKCQHSSSAQSGFLDKNCLKTEIRLFWINLPIIQFLF